MNASKQIHSTDPEKKIWQRAFHDHIIRSENDYQKIWEYIDTNPLKWKEDCFYNEQGGVAKCAHHAKHKKRLNKAIWGEFEQ